MILNIFSILASGQNVLKAFCQLYLLNNSWIHPFPLFHLNFYSISASWIFHTLPNCSLCLRFFQLKSIFCTAALISFQKKKLPTMLHLWIFSFLCFLFWIFVLHFGMNFKSELLNMEYNALSSRSFLPLTSSLSLSLYMVYFLSTERDLPISLLFQDNPARWWETGDRLYLPHYYCICLEYLSFCSSLRSLITAHASHSKGLLMVLICFSCVYFLFVSLLGCDGFQNSI